WPPSAPDPLRGSVVEPDSDRQLLRTGQSPPNPQGGFGPDGYCLMAEVKVNSMQPAFAGALTAPLAL
ncbi:hypothetical protein, partial [Salmonella enterica]